jgi:hypothetical protein
MVRALLLVLFMVSLGAVRSWGHTWYVKPDSTGDAPTIQDAVDSAACHGGRDTVLVAAGTYTHFVTREDTIVANVVIGRVGLPDTCNPDNTILISESGPDSTVLDGDHDHRVVFLMNVVGCELSGFTIRNGKATGGRGGGGICCAESIECTIGDNMIIWNHGAAGGGGGGIFCAGSQCSVSISGNLIDHNDALDYQGGGVYCGKDSRVAIKGNEITDNEARQGGGIACASGAFEMNRVAIDENTISGNSASSQPYPAEGGGLFIQGFSRVVLRDNRIINNEVFPGAVSGIRGGAIRTENVRPVHIEGNIIAGNVIHSDSSGWGGGLSLQGSGLNTLRSNTIDSNIGGLTGGGVHLSPSSTNVLIENNIITNNTAIEAGGIYCGATPDTFICNDIWNNSGGNTSGCDSGQYNFSEDPRFCDRYNYDYYLNNGSPCRSVFSPDNCGLVGALGVACWSGGGCPFVRVWTGSGYIEDNNILSESEINPMTPPYVHDHYHLGVVPTLDGARYRLEICEPENQHVMLDFVQLIVADHDSGSAVVVAPNGRILGYTGLLAPLSARGSDNVTYLDAVSQVGDSLIFEGWEGDALEVGFGGRGSQYLAGALDGGSGTVVILSADKIPQDPGGGRDGDAQRGIQVEVMAHSGWEHVGSILPRAHWSEGVVELDLDSLGVSDEVTVRLVGTGHYKVDLVAFLVGGNTDVTITEVLPVSASHSGGGSVLDSCLASDHRYAALFPGETIVFDFPDFPKVSALERDFFLECHGYYTTPVGDPLLGSPRASDGESTWLGLNSPNPFDTSTLIPYSLGAGSWTRLAVYDVRGREVAVLVEKQCEQGRHLSIWDGRNRDRARVSPGIYFYRMDCRGFSGTRKLILLGNAGGTPGISADCRTSEAHD